MILLLRLCYSWKMILNFRCPSKPRTWNGALCTFPALKFCPWEIRNFLRDSWTKECDKIEIWGRLWLITIENSTLFLEYSFWIPFLQTGLGFRGTEERSISMGNICVLSLSQRRRHYAVKRRHQIGKSFCWGKTHTRHSFIVAHIIFIDNWRWANFFTVSFSIFWYSSTYLDSSHNGTS